MTAAILRGAAAHLPLADASVDLIVTSPPYWSLRSYTDGGEHYAGQIGAEPTPAEYIDSLIECTREWMRVLKPTGSIWVNLGDKYGDRGHGPSRGRGTSRGPQAETLRQTRGPMEKSLLGMPWRYALRCIDDLGLILRAEVVWSKPNGLPESVTDRVRRSHEQWFHFVKSPRYYSAIDAIRDPASDYVRPRNVARATSPPPGNKPRTMTDSCNPLGRLPGSVWTVPTQPLKVPAELGIDHFAAFPMEFPRRIIQGWSPVGGLVLDPFGGTGTTALVAHAYGRHGISVDMSADYCRLAAWRTSDPGQLAAALEVEKPTPPLAGQLELFGAVTAG
jgi:DNA modification methylase